MVGWDLCAEEYEMGRRKGRLGIVFKIGISIKLKSLTSLGMDKNQSTNARMYGHSPVFLFLHHCKLIQVCLTPPREFN